MIVQGEFTALPKLSRRCKPSSVGSVSHNCTRVKALQACCQACHNNTSDTRLTATSSTSQQYLHACTLGDGKIKAQNCLLPQHSQPSQQYTAQVLDRMVGKVSAKKTATRPANTQSNHT